MSGGYLSRCRICLVTPVGYDPATFAPLLADALSGGDVASLIIAEPAIGTDLQRAAEKLVPIAQARDVAAVIRNDTRIVGRVGADGVHIDSGPTDLAAAITALRPKKFVGAANLRSRHDAMTAGEAGPDYLFFGRLDGDGDDLIFDKALELATWWAEVGVIPTIVMGGRTLGSLTQAAETRIEFVALSRAVFEYPGGPAAAVVEANRLLSAAMEPTS